MRPCLILPNPCSGIKVELIDKIGMHSSDTTMIFMEDVRVPYTNIIGQEGMGFFYQMLQFQEERLWAGAGSKSPLRMSRQLLCYCSQTENTFAGQRRACTETQGDPESCG